MTRGCLTVPIMRPNHRWTVLCVAILAVLLLTLNAHSEDSKCETQIKVRRQTVYEAFLGQELKMTCTVAFCNSSPPTVSWFKLEKSSAVKVSSSSHIKIEWKSSNQSEGLSFLTFQNILSNDSGRYQCQSGDSVSHVIFVSVYGDGEHPNVTKNDTKSPSSNSKLPENIWVYVYLAAGIVVFVIIVIVISIISMKGCKGKSKKETQNENQYLAIPMVEQPFPHASLPPTPKGSPSAPPSRRSTRRKTPPSQPNDLTSPRNNKQVYDKMAKDRERQRNTVQEEESSIVYAALNHQLPAGAAPRPQRLQEEFSEYAAIRVS